MIQTKANALMVLVLLLFLSPTLAIAMDHYHGDSALPRAYGKRNPGDAGERVPRIVYQSVTSATKSYRPVDPLSWEELNRRVTPRRK